MKIDIEKERCYRLAGVFLENADPRRLQEELGEYLYRIFKSKERYRKIGDNHENRY